MVEETKTKLQQNFNEEDDITPLRKASPKLVKTRSKSFEDGLIMGSTTKISGGGTEQNIGFGEDFQHIDEYREVYLLLIVHGIGTIQ